MQSSSLCVWISSVKGVVTVLGDQMKENTFITVLSKKNGQY